MERILGYAPTLHLGLQAFITAKKSGVAPAIPWGIDFFERLETFATTGKLLRGSVLCFSYEMFSGKLPDAAVIKAAMALELTHSALLIHDDIMDGDSWRRGQASLHHQYELIAQQENIPDSGQFGTNMAMCGGDAALFLAFELLSESQAGTPGNTSYTLFVNQLLNTCMGQMQDLYFEARPGMPSKQAIYKLMEAKTAAYTLAMPLAMGAAIAGQTPKTLQKLQAIGIAAGTIFQIRDDELGIMGDPQKTGKPTGSDIKEGKKTLLYYYLLKKCKVPERAKLKTLFGNPGATREDIAYVKKLVRQHHVAGLLDEEIKKLERKAVNQIEKLAVANKFKAELVQLVRFCSKRLA